MCELTPAGTLQSNVAGVNGADGQTGKHKPGLMALQKQINMADVKNVVSVGIDPRAIRWLRRAWGVTPYM